jgi:hypothetical protein
VGAEGGEVGDEVVAEVQPDDVREDVQFDEWELGQLAARLAKLPALPLRLLHYFIIQLNQYKLSYSNH